MKISWAIWIVLAGVILAVPAARATVGGGTFVTVLGYDPTDDKIYYLVDGAGGHELPDLYFMRVSGPRAGAPVRAKSVKVNIEDGDYAAFEGRIGRIKKRLIKMAPRGRSKRDSDSVLPPPVPHVEVKRKKTGKRTRVYSTGKDGYVKCPVVSVSVTDDGRQGSVAVTECRGHARVAGIFNVGKRVDVSFVLVASIPDLFEGGYVTETPLLLRRPPPKTK